MAAQMDNVPKTEEPIAGLEAEIQAHPHDDMTGKVDSFRVTGRKFLLTYKNWLNKQIFTEGYQGYFPGFNNVFKNNKVEEFHIAYETGDENTYKHMHICIAFEKKCDIKNPRIFDIMSGDGRTPAVHPHIKMISTAKGQELQWIKAVRYLAKEDPACADLKHYGQDTLDQKKEDAIDMVAKIAMIQGASSLTIAYGYASSFKDIGAIKNIYEARTPQFNFVTPYQPLPWQSDLLSELETTSQYKCRKIIWYYDERGACGKSTFCDLASAKFGSKVMSLDNLGKVSDTAHLIANRQAGGVLPSIFLLDLPRSYQDRDTIYSVAEMIANGRMTSVKYAGAELVFKTEHIVVLANFLPDIYKMSLDRWDIRPIYKDASGTIVVTRLSPYDALTLRNRQEGVVSTPQPVFHFTSLPAPQLPTPSASVTITAPSVPMSMPPVPVRVPYHLSGLPGQ